MTAKATRDRAEQIIAALDPAERTAANRAFFAIAGRVWTNDEIIAIATWAKVNGYPFIRAARVTAGWVALAKHAEGANERPVQAGIFAAAPRTEAE